KTNCHMLIRPSKPLLNASNNAAVSHNPHSTKTARAFLLVGFVAAAARADSSHKP
ncbi:MAG: hypothetical protein ACI9ND_003269, partial [Yoonia sp.]